MAPLIYLAPKVFQNRALLLAALACGKTVLTNLLDSDDVRHMLNALSALGINYTLSADRTRCDITGKWRRITCARRSGTVSR
ncbi:3-phosphoshikimate 1-carboxyvinyltransferase [Salmonella enterica subsp. enterica]|uniref:3-phosphoshikimate 1-carboxyvinyltransferase n=1 Tax=Salmonella enterica I TaxID=59201 RepID=A0A3S4I5X3_SALET|nr:3-phosphoshikimate 1-carboxyvinyltransferase [Salmonella enterica subsp. enterica]